MAQQPSTTQHVNVATPVIDSRRAWLSWLRGDNTITAGRLRPAVVHERSRDVLLSISHRGDLIREAIWTLADDELAALATNGVHGENLTGRVLDELGEVLDQPPATTSRTPPPWPPRRSSPGTRRTMPAPGCGPTRPCSTTPTTTSRASSTPP